MRLDGKQLDDFLELAAVENMRNGARIELVEGRRKRVWWKVGGRGCGGR